jgi:hypothetical protein
LESTSPEKESGSPPELDPPEEEKSADVQAEDSMSLGAIFFLFYFCC